MKAIAKHEQTTVVDSKTFRPIAGVNRVRTQESVAEKATVAEEKREQRSEEIAFVSPEGTPAHPEFTGSGMLMMLALVMVVVLIACAVVWVLFGPAAAAVVLFLGTAVGVGSNTVIWSGLLRARERQQIEKQHGEA